MKRQMNKLAYRKKKEQEGILKFPREESSRPAGADLLHLPALHYINATIHYRKKH